VRDRAGKVPLVPPNTDSLLPQALRRRGWDEGLYFFPRGSLLLMAPPLIVQPEHIEEGIDKLDRLLRWLEATERIA
jgi:adenosylmethionine-8-amino-7-oxononanoate aminotransferase